MFFFFFKKKQFHTGQLNEACPDLRPYTGLNKVTLSMCRVPKNRHGLRNSERALDAAHLDLHVQTGFHGRPIQSREGINIIFLYLIFSTFHVVGQLTTNGNEYIITIVSMRKSEIQRHNLTESLC